MDQAVHRPAGAQPVGESRGGSPLLGSVGVDGPLRGLHVEGGDVGRLATHREPYVARGQPRVDRVAEPVDPLPLRDRVGPRHPRVLVDPADRVGELEAHLARVDAARDRGRARRVRGRRQRDVPLAGEQPRGGIEPDPAGAGDEDLGPGVKVGEVLRQAVRSADVGRQLDQVAGDEASGEAELSQHGDEQPGGVPARTEALAEGLLRCLDPRFEPDRVVDVVAERLVEGDQEVDDGDVARADPPRHPVLDRGAAAGLLTDAAQVRLEIGGESRVIAERERGRRTPRRRSRTG